MSGMVNENNSNNNGLVNVKVDFYGDLRRFAVARDVSFKALENEVAALLNLSEKDRQEKELVIKYFDEEKDLITVSSDVELKCAFPAEGLFRLVVSFKNGNANNNNNPLDANAMDVSDGSTQPVGEQAYQHQPPFFGPFGGRGRGGWGPWGRGCRGGRGFYGAPHHPYLHLHPHPHPHPHPHGFPHPPPPPPPDCSVPHGFPQPFAPPFEGFGPHGGFGHHGFGKQDRKCVKMHMKVMEKMMSGDAPAWMGNKETLVQQVMQMGFDVDENKVLKLLLKFDGDVNEVAKVLLKRKEKKEWKMAKKQEKYYN